MQIEIVPKGYFRNISEFKFIKDIGVGSFGKVKLATHCGTRKLYAVKTIELNSDLTEMQLQVIAREIKLHSKLDHPHIIKLWDTLFENNTIYMIMDYAKNGSLFKFHTRLLQQGHQPSASQVYQFFYQTLQALKYLHANDIMHRDIKPENLLLDEDLNIKLCDYGWATNQITMSRTTFCGTYQYMAPEMALEKNYDYRIDIWALGVLLYELVHGKAPFQAENLKVMKQKINKGAYEIHNKCTSPLKDLIVDLLQFTPEKRLSIEQIQNHIWVQSCQDMVFNGRNEFSDDNTQVSHCIKDKKSQQFKKHTYQRSMGNMDNFYAETKKANLKSNLVQIENVQRMKQNFLISGQQTEFDQSKHNEVKKHKRNVTQTFNKLTQASDEQSQKFNLKKAQLIYSSLKTESDTPQAVQHQEQKQQFNVIPKFKKKCKTQGQEDFLRYETQYSMKKTYEQQQMEIKKKRTMQTETGPLIPSSVYNSHLRNYSSGQLKQNDPSSYISLASKDKVKKRPKAQDKTSKMKKIQEKFIQISAKFMNKERERS